MESGARITPDNAAPVRLRPEMSSLKLLVLNWVRGYIGRWGESPSYGEIAEAFGIGRSSVKRAIKRLVADGLLLQRPGHRGLALPQDRDNALRTLRALGFPIDEDIVQGHLPQAPGTNSTLLPPPALDYAAAGAAEIDGGGKGSAS